MLKKRERRPGERPEEIAAAALNLFCKRGYNVTTIDEIAAAGVTKGAVYHHFDSKEDLLQSAMTNFFDSALERAMESVANSPARSYYSLPKVHMPFQRDASFEHSQKL
ncbi:MAG: TetR/AcrR family transcriptional regulator [Bryobacteraceae bacterium]